MDWKVAMEQERAALMRLVALLYSLAALAERAGGRSPAVRGFVLWILRHAEAMARDFVTSDPDTPPASVPVVPAGGCPADAMRLAASFRALARQLDRQARLVLETCGEDGGAIEPQPFGRMPDIGEILRALSALAAFARRAPHPTLAPDTS